MRLTVLNQLNEFNNHKFKFYFDIFFYQIGLNFNLYTSFSYDIVIDITNSYGTFFSFMGLIGDLLVRLIILLNI